MHRLATAIIIAAAAALKLCAAAPFATLSERADRSFQWHEWASAAALYELMLDQRPDSADIYAHAIVASALIPDSTATIDLMQRAMDHGQDFSFITDRVRAISYRVGQPELYADYLHRLRRAMPWMRRPLDNALLQYYTFRDDGPNIVAYAETMLQGLPDSREFLHLLARGYMLQAMWPQAVDTWKRIAELYPDDFDSLIYLANYYTERGDTASAAPYLQRALALNPTPYLQALAAEKR